MRERPGSGQRGGRGMRERSGSGQRGGLRPGGRMLSLGLILSFLVCSLGGCALGGSGEGRSVDGFAFNTTYRITIYEGGSQETLDDCVAECSRYDGIFSRTDSHSELYKVNDIARLYDTYREEESLRRALPADNRVDFQIREDGSLACEISRELQEILKSGLRYGEESGGAFDITIAPVSSLWDFTGGHPAVPAEEELRRGVEKVSFKNLSLEKGKVVFHKPGMGLDLGGIAKGYIADALKKYLTDRGVKSGMINLGGNILCIGKKPGGGKFRIGVQQPFADRNETVTAVDVEGISVVSSGIYERYFQKDGVLYHHILNPKTGYSYDNDLMAVTILSRKSTDGDALSTTCFSLGRERGLDYINAREGVEALFITRDEKMYYSRGWKQYSADER